MAPGCGDRSDNGGEVSPLIRPKPAVTGEPECGVGGGGAGSGVPWWMEPQLPGL